MSSKVSVVVRTKDRILLLERAMRSVLAQTLPDLELIVVNDGGDGAAVRQLVGHLVVGADRRVTVIDNPGVPGRSGALDTGVSRTSGTYVAIHDDDDAWHPDFLATTCGYLDEHPDDGAVATHTEIVRERIAGGVITELSREILAHDIDVASLVETLWANYIPPIAMVFRRSVLDAVGSFDTSLPVLEDWEFNLRLLSSHTVGFIGGEPLARWHQRESAYGPDSDSVVADARDHAMFDLLIRDEYLRKSIAHGGSIGPLVAAAMMIRRVDRNAQEIANGHRNQISELSQIMSLELGRLRGEVIALRQLISDDRKKSGEGT